MKNIQKSIKDYAIYFLTLVLGVAIFYVFNSIESQTVMMKVSSNTLEIINIMNQCSLIFLIRMTPIHLFLQYRYHTSLKNSRIF